MAPPDFVVIGHVVRDILQDGWRLGGTATFAALQAQRLGRSAGIVTRVDAELDLGDLLPDIAVAGRSSERTTSFENVYDGARRSQCVPEQADVMTIDDLPPDWRSAGMVLVGPVCGEVPPDAGAWCSAGLMAVSAQGWLRELDGERRVRRVSWRGEPFWRDSDVVFLSEEDLGGDLRPAEQWGQDVPIVAVTTDRRGARVHADGRWRAIEAFPADEVDPTGAGDIFAAAFLVRYDETGDVARAARFASAAAACSVEAAGAEGVADRDAVEARMEAHAEIALR